LRLTNNLIGSGAVGQAEGTADVRAKWVPGAIIARNALVRADIAGGQGAEGNRPYYSDQAMHAFFPNAAAAGINADGTLTAKSPNRRTGTDGKDIGVDFDELQRATAGQPTR